MKIHMFVAAQCMRSSSRLDFNVANELLGFIEYCMDDVFLLASLEDGIPLVSSTKIHCNDFIGF